MSNFLYSYVALCIYRKRETGLCEVPQVVIEKLGDSEEDIDGKDVFPVSPIESNTPDRESEVFNEPSSKNIALCDTSQVMVKEALKYLYWALTSAVFFVTGLLF